MAKILLDVDSQVLGKKTQICLLTPEGDFGGEEPAVLYLLHGNGDNCTSWVRRSRIEEYVKGKNLLVILPQVERSYYCDMAHGPRWFTYLTQEVEGICRREVSFTHDRARTFVAGLSMGGYGALKWALTQPQRFAAAASLSGTTDIVGRIAALTPNRLPEFAAIFGEELQVPPASNLFTLASQIPPAACPRLYLACGRDDKFIAFNRDFVRHLRELELPVRYDEAEGDHNWAFWDRWIQPALDFFEHP